MLTPCTSKSRNLVAVNRDFKHNQYSTTQESSAKEQGLHHEQLTLQKV
jgi:hypothetical protein